jgi:glutathione S-transferase
MQLIGMLDSPYVRRVAISLQLLGLRFEHRSISVFRGVDEFRRINPVVKAPSLVCDDGEVLMDSTLILEYAQALAGPGRRLMPTAPAELAHELRLVGLALAACEKSVQIVYERMLRPAEKQHAPWIERVGGQLQAAFAGLELGLRERTPAASSAALTQAGVSAAVAWYFARRLTPEFVAEAAHPALRDFSARAERLPEFEAAPHGDGTCRFGP